MNLRFLITGKPGCGKSTIASRVASVLGRRAGGMLTRELRERGRRVGFEVLDIATGRRALLAHVSLSSTYRIGRYGVDLSALEEVGVEAVQKALEERRFIIIDEIGPMELLSRAFIHAVEKVFSAPVDVLATVHLRSSHPLVKELKSRRDVVLHVINERNREQVLQELLEVVT